MALVVLGVLVAVAASTPSALAQDPIEAPGSFGIRLLPPAGAPPEDPRAQRYLLDHLAPGTTTTRQVEVTNDTDGTRRIDVYAAAANLGGGAITFTEGQAQNDLTSWTTVEPGHLDLPAGGTGTATVTIAVPADASPGERYGVVWAQMTSEPRPGAVTTANRVGVRMYVSVGEGGAPPTDFTIDTLDAQRDPQGNPLVVARVTNTGGRALDLAGELALVDGPGRLSAGPFPVQPGTTVGVGETTTVTVPLDAAISGGPWTARLALRSGLVERTATAPVTFPDAPGASTGPVTATSDEGGGGWPLPALIGGGVAVVALVAGAAWALVARRPG